MSMGQGPGQEPAHYAPQQSYDASYSQAPQQWTGVPGTPKRQHRSLPWIIVGAVLVVLAAAAVVVWLILAQSSARDRATAEHEKAVVGYEQAWESLQDRIDASTLLLAEAENTEAVGGDELDTARASLEEAERIERIEPEAPESLPGAAEIEADTERILQAEEEVSAADEALADDFEALRKELIGQIVAGLEAQIELSQQVVGEAQSRSQGELAAGLSALIGEARAIIDDSDSTTQELYDVWDRLIDETDAVTAAITPTAADIDGTWCAVDTSECQTIELPKGHTSWGTVTLTEYGISEQGCFSFTAQPDGSEVGGYMVFYCPAGIPAGALSDADRAGEDRLFEGQAYPMQMSVRQ